MKQPLNEQFIRMQKLAGIITEEKFYSRNYIKQKYKAKAKEIENNIEDEMDNNPNIWDLYISLETPKEVDDFIKGFINENKVNFQPHLNEGSDTYPFKATPEVIALYDKIANELEGTISMVANKLEIPESDIRICLDYLYDDLQGNKAKKRGMFIQVKTDDAKWDEAWTGNPLIMQTTNDEGIIIPSNPFFGVNIKGNKNPKVRAIYNKALDLDLEALAASENTKIADLVSPEEMKLIAPNTPIIVTGKSNLNENLNFDYQDKETGPIIVMDDNTMDAILDNPELQDYINPKSFTRNNKSEIVLGVDNMDYEQFDKLAKFLGIKY
jgi:hypothetical protein